MMDLGLVSELAVSKRPQSEEDLEAEAAVKFRLEPSPAHMRLLQNLMELQPDVQVEFARRIRSTMPRTPRRGHFIIWRWAYRSRMANRMKRFLR